MRTTEWMPLKSGRRSSLLSFLFKWKYFFMQVSHWDQSECFSTFVYMTEWCTRDKMTQMTSVCCWRISFCLWLVRSLVTFQHAQQSRLSEWILKLWCYCCWLLWIHFDVLRFRKRSSCRHCLHAAQGCSFPQTRTQSRDSFSKSHNHNFLVDVVCFWTYQICHLQSLIYCALCPALASSEWVTSDHLSLRLANNDESFDQIMLKMISFYEKVERSYATSDAAMAAL